MQQLLPNYIASESLDGLRGLMAQVSVKRNGTVNFFSVYHDGKNHVAWYHDTPENIMAEIKARKNEGQSKG